MAKGEQGRNKRGPKRLINAKGRKIKHMARAEALEQTGKLYLMGFGQAEIAKRLGVSQAQVSYDIKKLVEMYKERAIADISQVIEEKLATIRTVRAMAFEGWEESLKDAEREAEEYGKARAKKEEEEDDSDLDDELRLVKKTLTREGRLPSNQFLVTILDTIRQERELLGLDAPKRVNVDQRVVTTQVPWEELYRPGPRPSDAIEAEIEAVASTPEPAAIPSTFPQENANGKGKRG